MTVVHTDGACSGTPGPGGWAWVTGDGRQGSGNDPSTTNQRMELQAALEALRAIEGPIVIVSDSAYLVNCFKEGWWRRWIERGWRTSKGPVANQDIWEPLIEEVQKRTSVHFAKVSGHSGDMMNDRADKLAVAAKRELMDPPAPRKKATKPRAPKLTAEQVDAQVTAVAEALLETDVLIPSPEKGEDGGPEWYTLEPHKVEHLVRTVAKLIARA